MAILDNLFGWGNQDAFWISGLIVITMGAVAFLSNMGQDVAVMTRRQVILAMITSWMTSAVGAALPFMLGAPHFNFTFAYFESMSAITTTGATVMNFIQDQPKSVLVWRSLMHWYGGMGVLIGGIVLLPAMRVGGMQFFLRVGFEDSDKILPSARGLALATFYVYSLLTLLCFISYVLTGMPAFDSINLAMSTMATGGLAVNDASFAIYEGAPEYAATVFMLFAGWPLLTFLMFTRGRWNAFARDPQIRSFMLVYAFMVLAIMIYRLLHRQGPFEETLRDTMFNTASMLTGTGFANQDFQLWGSFPIMVLFLCMFIGGCTGSTAGSIKIFRYQVLIAMVKVRIQRLYHPHGVFPPRYDGQALDEKVMESVAAFFMVYLMSLAILTTLFGFSGLDLITGFSAAVSAVGNVGPGLGPEIGPVGNYSGLNDFPLWVFTIAMMIGRLEFMIFFTLLLPRFWQN